MKTVLIVYLVVCAVFAARRVRSEVGFARDIKGVPVGDLEYYEPNLSTIPVVFAPAKAMCAVVRRFAK